METSSSHIRICSFLWELTERDYDTYVDIIGHDPSGKTVMARVRHYPWLLVNCYTERVADMMMEDVALRVGRGLVNAEKVKKQNPHGYNLTNEVWCVKITLSSMPSYWYARRVVTRSSDKGLGKGGAKSTPLYDDRYEYYMWLGQYKVQLEFDVHQTYKFRLDNGLPVYGWLEILATEGESSEMGTKFSHSYHVDCHSDIRELTAQEASGMPVINPKVLSYDLEVFPSNYPAFTDCTIPADEVYLNTVSFWDGTDAPIRKWAFTHMPHSYTPQENETLEVTKDEMGTIRGLFTLIDRLDPDFVIGHNIFGYDNAYIDGRMGNDNLTSPNCSRYAGYTCKPIDKSWSSSARKKEIIFTFDYKGRLWLDTLPYTRIYYQLRSYSLKNLAKHFLSAQKIELTPKQQYLAYKANDVTSVVEYGIRDSLLPILLFKRLDCWTNVTSDANVRGIDIFDIYTRGQGLGVFAQEYSTCYRDGYFLAPFKRIHTSEKFVGATVLSAKVGIYKRVHHLDFAGLYPSIIQAKNLCYSTLVTDPSIPDDMCSVFHVPNKAGHLRKMRFIKKQYREGILPRFLRLNKVARNIVKANMELVPFKSHEWNVLNARQNNIKLSSNGTYGNKTAPGSKTPCYEVGEVTTYEGRRSIDITQRILAERFYANIIYGDTDSVLFTIPYIDNQPVELMDRIGRRIAEEITKEFEKPMSLDFEKWWEDYFLFSKKNYVGYMADPKRLGNVNYSKTNKYFSAKGVCMVKRDVPIAVQEMFYEMVNHVFQYPDDKEKLIDIYEGWLQKLPTLDFSLMAPSTTIGENYKMENDMRHLFIQKMATLGYNMQCGDRVEYVFVKTGGGKDEKKGNKMDIMDRAIEQGMQLDYAVYVEGTFQKKAEKIFKLHAPELMDRYKAISKKWITHYRQSA